MKITIKQIADEVGVSPTTVSNVINNKSKRVSFDTQKKIRSVMKKYDYSPNMNARSLVDSSSKLIGLLYYSNDGSLVDFSEPFVSEILYGIERKINNWGYFVLLHSVANLKDIEIVKNNWKFEGFICVGFTSEMVEIIEDKFSVPLVYVDTYINEESSFSFSNYTDITILNTDDFGVGVKATEYLIDNGHRDIAFLSYSFKSDKPSVIQQRENGFSETMRLNKIEIKESVHYNENEFEKFYGDINKYTAVFVTADELALKLIYFLKNKNVILPKELSIIGVDDIRYAAYSMPELTTVRIEQRLKGESAIELLIANIEEKKCEHFVSLDSSLIIRDSVMNIKK